MTSEVLTESWYARARDDLRLRRRIEAELGDPDALDLLWWREHPDATTPDGAASPFSGRDELKRLVYAKATSESERAAAIAALQDLDLKIGELTARVDAAVARAQAPSEDPAPTPTSNAAAARQHRPAWPRIALFGAVAVGAFAAGLITAATFPTTTVPDQRIEDIEAAPTEVPALGIFEDGQPATLAAGALPATLERASAVSVGEIGTSKLIVVRNTSGQGCLAALAADGGVTATCVSDEDFPKFGLRLTWSERIATGNAPVSIADFYAIWMPDGTVTSGGSNRS